MEGEMLGFLENYAWPQLNVHFFPAPLNSISVFKSIFSNTQKLHPLDSESL